MQRNPITLWVCVTLYARFVFMRMHCVHVCVQACSGVLLSILMAIPTEPFPSPRHHGNRAGKRPRLSRGPWPSFACHSCAHTWTYTHTCTHTRTHVFRPAEMTITNTLNTQNKHLILNTHTHTHNAWTHTATYCMPSQHRSTTLWAQGSPKLFPHASPSSKPVLGISQLTGFSQLFLP